MKHKILSNIKQQSWLLSLSIPVGLISGFSAWAFLTSLREVTNLRINNLWIIIFLPIIGLAIGLIYLHKGKNANLGNQLLLDEIHNSTAWVPRRMAPLVFFGTVATHLFGGSVGREGAALQIAGSLTDTMLRFIKPSPNIRRLLLITALAGGFGAVFGVPITGAIFAMEVQRIGRIKYRAFFACVAASFVGDYTVDLLGYQHERHFKEAVSLSVGVMGKLFLAGIVFGLLSIAFVELTHFISKMAKKAITYLPLRLFAGGVIVIMLSLIVGSEYLGLSIGILERSIAGNATSVLTSLTKLVLTAISIGFGFPGGEVTPLLVVGSTAGAFLAQPLGLSIVLLTSIGLVAVFSGSANAPIASVIMCSEMFGAKMLIPAAVVCGSTYLFSNYRGLYLPHHKTLDPSHYKVDLVPRILKWGFGRKWVR